MTKATKQSEPKKKSVAELKKEWQAVCEKSDGNRIFLTGEMERKALAYQAKRQAFERLSIEFAQASSEFEHEKEAYFLQARKDIVENGINEDPWSKSIGFDEQAKKDGFMVLNLMEAKD